jgi:NhaA family Na+:H+ antiporter
MVVPACLYLAVNGGTPQARGWGVPMATDIAFAVGVLALLGPRVPPALRILLLALAVIDDVGAIIVIAIFYSAGLNLAGLALVGAGLLILLGMQKLGVRSPFAYLLPGLVVWAGAYLAGIHPTLAGVVVGLATPVRAWFGARRFVAEAAATVEAVRSDGGHGLAHRLDNLDLARREAVSPVDRLLHALHPWVAFVIMPVFALSNAGVVLDASSLRADGMVMSGVFLGLALGKPLGVLGFSWLAVRLRLVALPAGIGWREMLVLGMVAGIGFTMALFIAGLAFPPGPVMEVAKLGILGASLLAGVAGLLAGRLLLGARARTGAAATAPAAELSTSA